MLWPLIVLGLAVPAAAVVGGNPAAPPEPDAAVVFTQKYGYSGRLEGLKDDIRGYYAFHGIRYAEPPLGQKRFQRPIRRYLAGEINATRNCPPCPQLDPRGSGRVIGREDCLCLNVFTPKMPGEEEGCPVIFYVHGGNYRSGSISPYGGQHFAQRDTIIVTAQYRLGSLGFLSTGRQDASGNTGMFDLRAAMAWIDDYIEFFGGDKKRIMVMGQGSGGSAASLLSLSPEGRSATGVAALSGAPLSPGAVKENPKKHAETLAEKTGCPKEPAERLLLCLRKMPVEKIVMVDQEIDTNMIDTNAFLDNISGRSGSGVRVEGKYDGRGLPPIIEEQPTDSLQRKHQRVPILTGVVSAETSNAVFGKYSKFLTTQLNAVRDFIKKDIIGGLKSVVDEVQGLNVLRKVGLQTVMPLPDYYQALFDSSLNVVDGLTQIAEATGDALFNFPAYQTVRSWSVAAPAFLYSFEHTGNLTKGSHFLAGLAITDNSDQSRSIDKKPKGPAHGDELAYLFEPLDDDGRSVAGDLSQTDARARESFLNVIIKFAHQKPAQKNQTKIFGFIPFSQDGEQYLKITDKVTVDKKFRFCQMGLWGNMPDRITDAFCKNVLGKLLNLPKLLDNPLGNVPNVLGNNHGLGGGLGEGLGGGLGGGIGGGGLGGGLLTRPKNPNNNPSVVPIFSNTYNNFGI